MSWTSIVIIGLVVALLVGPISLAMPSKRDSKLAKLRGKAQSFGFQVKLTTLDSGSGSEKLAVYTLPWKTKLRITAGRLVRTGYVHEIHFCNDWAWESGQPIELSDDVIALLLSELPILSEQVRCLGFDQTGVSVYWRELGGMDYLEILYRNIDQLRQRIAATPNSLMLQE